MGVAHTMSGDDLARMLPGLRPMAMIADVDGAEQDGFHVMKVAAGYDRSLPILLLDGNDQALLGAMDAVRGGVGSDAGGDGGRTDRSWRFGRLHLSGRAAGWHVPADAGLISGSGVAVWFRPGAVHRAWGSFHRCPTSGAGGLFSHKRRTAGSDPRSE